MFLSLGFFEDMECQLTQVAESDDSESEDKLAQYFFEAVKKETRPKPVIDGSNWYVCRFNSINVNY